MLKKVPYRETDLQGVYARLDELGDELTRLEEEEGEEDDEEDSRSAASSGDSSQEEEEDDITIEQRSIACQVHDRGILVTSHSREILSFHSSKDSKNCHKK